LVAREVRGKSAVHSAARFHPSKGAKALHKVLVSAMANAAENHGLTPESLQIANISVDEGPRLKRIQARAMGRANRIIKKTSHITVVVEDVEAAEVVKAHGTKAKARPTFAAGGRGKKGVKAQPKAAPARAAQEPAVELSTVAETAPELQSTPVEVAETQAPAVVEAVQESAEEAKAQISPEAGEPAEEAPKTQEEGAQ
jgi:large subunit ribosomal protein L22